MNMVRNEIENDVHIVGVNAINQVLSSSEVPKR